jgi:hypothetical protein
MAILAGEGFNRVSRKAAAVAQEMLRITGSSAGSNIIYQTARLRSRTETEGLPAEAAQ